MAHDSSELVDWARECKITREQQQQELTAQWLKPVQEELVRLARQYRQRVDQFLRARLSATEPAADINEIGEREDPERYPIGYCRQIRDAVWGVLSSDPLVMELRRHGLVWKRVYFISGGKYFQNAIQFGDLLLDVAHDTVDRADEPVVATELTGTQFENIDGWSRYAEVAESYLGLRLYANVHFPLLFPLAPFLAVRRSGQIELAYYQNMIFLLDLGDGWTRARKLLSDERWMSRQMPASAVNRLEQFAKSSAFPVEFQRGNRATVQQTLKEWDEVLTLSPEQRTPPVEYAQKLTSKASRLLRAADIRADLVRSAGG